MNRPGTVHESLYRHETGFTVNARHLVSGTMPSEGKCNADELTFVHPSDMNECESQPCLNEGECMDLVANFTCVCPAAFTGTLCETGDFKSTLF